MTWTVRADAELAELRAIGRWRHVRSLDGPGPAFRLDGREVVSFASNDYLGLTQHPAVRAAAHRAIDDAGTGAGSARLIVGGRLLHDELEAAPADWKGAQAALLFPTGLRRQPRRALHARHEDVTIISDERSTYVAASAGCLRRRSRKARGPRGLSPRQLGRSRRVVRLARDTGVDPVWWTRGF